MRTISPWMGRLLQGLSWKKLFWILLGAAIATFGIHNIHQQAGITEGGVIGAMLLAGHWLGFSPSVITPVLDVACYLLAWRYLGGMFIKISVLSTLHAAGPLQPAFGCGTAGRAVRGHRRGADCPPRGFQRRG